MILEKNKIELILEPLIVMFVNLKSEIGELYLFPEFVICLLNELRCDLTSENKTYFVTKEVFFNHILM